MKNLLSCKNVLRKREVLSSCIHFSVDTKLHHMNTLAPPQMTRSSFM